MRGSRLQHRRNYDAIDMPQYGGDVQRHYATIPGGEVHTLHVDEVATHEDETI